MAVISIFFCIFLFFSFSEARVHVGGGGAGFTTSLFHRDSLHTSPLSRYDRVINAFRRSVSRSDFLLERATAVPTAAIHSKMIPASGEFFMSISLGTPKTDFIAFADTGSDLTWTQCLPCEKCFNQSYPIFNPRQSYTFRHVPCTSEICDSFQFSRCGTTLQSCTYDFMYAGHSTTQGELAYETITIGLFKLHRTVIGCAHLNSGNYPPGTSGIIGLGGGDFSLISQMNKNAHVKRRFSHCLPNFLTDANITGKINFGLNAVVPRYNSVSTPLISRFTHTVYYLTLEAVSVGKIRIEGTDNETSAASLRGNVIIDSGTTVTILPLNFYDGIVSALLSVIVKAERVDDPSNMFELCYGADNVDDLDIPVITAHFAGGADVKLLPLNTFYTVDSNLTCLIMMPSMTFGIIGNLAQVNFLIGFDLDRKTVTFKPTVCG